MWKNSPTFAKTCCFTLLVLLSLISEINAQTVSPSPTPSPTEANVNQVPVSRPAADLTTNPPPPSEGTIEGGYLSSREFVVAILISIVAMIALTMQFFLLKAIPKLKAEESLRSFAIILILMGTLFVIAAGFDSIQIAPAMGLFGTIAGYLLGRVDKKEAGEGNE